MNIAEREGPQGQRKGDTDELRVLLGKVFLLVICPGKGARKSDELGESSPSKMNRCRPPTMYCKSVCSVCQQTRMTCSIHDCMDRYRCELARRMLP